MKTMIRLSLISILCIVVFSCGSKKSTTAAPANTSTSSAPPAKPVPVVAEPVQLPKDGTTRFVVSFYSIGGGIDSKIHEDFVNLMTTYSKTIGFTPIHWGREGETDYCLTLKELSPAEQVEFIKKANQILARSKMVNKKENSSCDHDNWPAPPAATTTAAFDEYRLVVSFYSEGGGTDLKAKEDFEKFLNSYPKKIAFEPTTWGREGETDYCLKLSELSSIEQADFVRKAKEMLSKSKLVHVDENAKCVHKH